MRTLVTLTSVIDGPHQPHRRSSRHTAHDNHLQRAPHAPPHVLPSPPTSHHPGLHPPKHKQRHDHDADADPQREQDLAALDAEVRQQRQEAADEIAHGDGGGGDDGAVGGGRWELLVEAHEEIEEFGGRVVEGFGDGGDGAVGEAVGREDGVDEGVSLAGGGAD